MATQILSLEEFRKTRVEVTDLSVTQWGWIDEEGPGYVYADGAAYINIDSNDRKPYLVIGNLQFDRSLEDLEKVLYEEHYLPEVAGVTEGESNG